MNSTANVSTDTVARLVSAIASVHGVKFVGFDYTAKGTGEVARHTVIIGADYKTLVQKSIEELTRMLPTLDGIRLEAASELINSFSKTFLALDTGTYHPANARAGTYTNLCPGLRLLDNGNLEITGLAHAKKVITPGVYKTVNSRPLTIAKDELRDLLPISKFRSFSVTPDNLHAVRIGGRKFR